MIATIEQKCQDGPVQDEQDDWAAGAVAVGDDDALRAILAETCRITGMGFAAIARVTEERWIACQVLDRIEFGLDPGDELKIKTTLCNDIRECGQAIVIDTVLGNERWRTHPAPMMYGFESYASFPILLKDGTFFGTLCAIDPEPRDVSAETTIATLERFAGEAGTIISRQLS